MVSEDVILQKYCTKGISKGGELLLCHTDALNLIEDCRELGMVILGLDFYIQTNQGIFEAGQSHLILHGTLLFDTKSTCGITV